MFCDQVHAQLHHLRCFQLPLFQRVVDIVHLQMILQKCIFILHCEPQMLRSDEILVLERQLCGRKCLVDVRSQRRMGRLLRDDRKTTLTQITTRYNQGMQNTISERTTRQTLKQMGYSSRRPHRVLLLSAKNRKQRLQFTQAHQNWTIEDWKNVAWSDESRFLLRHSDVG